jgi:5'-nucleotidase
VVRILWTNKFNMPAKPLILLTNDDGIEAPGLAVLRDAASQLGDLLVVAPEKQCSATSHTVTVFRDMPYRRVERDGALWGHALDGMPPDCVKLGVLTLAPRKPDLVISGINPGANIGNNILYSGTVAAAREGAMLGVPSIALSLACNRAVDKAFHFETASEWALRLAPMVLERGLPTGVILNVNVPNLPMDAVRGGVVTRQGKVMFIDDMQLSHENGVQTYRNVGSNIVLEGEHGDDVDDAVLRAHKVSITPLHYDLTHHAFRDELTGWPGLVG